MQIPLAATLLIATTGGVASPPVSGPPTHGTAVTFVARAEPDTIGLLGTARASGARGFVRITSMPAPFNLTVTAAGDPVLDLEFIVEGLLDPAPLGGDRYVVWVASPQLDRYERIGTLENHARARGSTSLPKWLAIVTVETGESGDRPAGPIVMHGLSPSGRLQSFQGHELFDGPKIGDTSPASGLLAVIDIHIVAERPLAVRFTLEDGRTVERRAAW